MSTPTPDPLAPIEPVPTTPDNANLNGWRRTVRTLLQTLVALAVAAPFIYEAVTQQSTEAATGAAATVLAVAATLARVMSLPQVEDVLQRIAPWLSAHAPIHEWSDERLDELNDAAPIEALPPDDDPDLPAVPEQDIPDGL